MFNLINKFVYWVLSVQEKVLRRNLKRTFKTSFTNSTSKVVFSKGNSLKLTTQTEKNKEKLKQEVQILLKKYENNPQKLLEFIEKNGTSVHKVPHAHLLLNAIGYEEGFVGSLKGSHALYLSFLTLIFAKGKSLSFNTEPMFVLRDLPVNPYYMIQQFHKWYAMKLNLPGFDSESQGNFQKFLNSSTDEEINTLSLDEILGLKEAIARDVEAINFVIDLAKSTDGTKNAMKKLTTGGATV